MRDPIVIACTLLLTACTLAGPSEPAGSLADSLELTGTARVITDANQGPSLAVSVSVRNRSSSPVDFVVLAYCPVLVRLHRPDAPGSAPVYSEHDRPCVRAGRRVYLAPGETDVLERSVPLQELRAGGVAPGRYLLVAVVTATEESPEVQVGEVEIP